ncbi:MULTISPECIES: flagellar hook-associated protein FlgK [unclassified Duganella]|uniref:flagellar hook-associated protein FlgK n=1 Tax=unclassified Duganella TaxID=2636909 RepID=UPI000887FD4E|nr:MULTISPECIES: flagellar hook-associated protein FlgK [unclassified Duganella]SDF67597.1 flagellar hook-associated protein 1 FlgK [Duganella sp. OV458]SDI61367.1 flagellar hook-associated protein 1 FlgK [Duganella sp. OV510]
MTISYNALSGALAAQAALNTVSQNIANSQTKGYTRQGALLQAIATDSGNLSPGNGVQVGSLLRFSDSYKLQQMWRANSELGYRSQVQPYLTQMETVMSDPKSSLSYGIDNFFKALNAAGVDPTSSPLRQQVITAADSMSQQFNSIYNVTANQSISVQQQQSAILPSLNQSLASIASLNKQIVSVGVGGTNTSALMDQREQLIDSVSAQVGVEVVSNPDGSVNVSLKSGQPLVVGFASSTLAFTTDGGAPVLTLSYQNVKFPLDETAVGGQLGGLGNYKVNTLLPLQTSIKEIAQQMADKVNAVLTTGQKSDGSPGEPLLVFNPTSATGLLEITEGIKTTDLAFSSDGTPGDSGNLQKLIDIKGQPITLTTLGTLLLGDADTQLVGKLGIDSQQNKAQLTTATTIRSQAEDDWKSTSAVNTDEEAINLMEFQNMYQANMKVIAVANALFDSTLQMFG